MYWRGSSAFSASHCSRMYSAAFPSTSRDGRRSLSAGRKGRDRVSAAMSKTQTTLEISPQVAPAWGQGRSTLSAGRGRGPDFLGAIGAGSPSCKGFQSRLLHDFDGGVFFRATGQTPRGARPSSRSRHSVSKARPRAQAWRKTSSASTLWGRISTRRGLDSRRATIAQPRLMAEATTGNVYRATPGMMAGLVASST